MTESRVMLCFLSLIEQDQFIKITVLFQLSVYQCELQISYRKQQMLGAQSGKLSPQDKKLFNILQLRIYDISQNVQILSKQLSTNQIKESVAQTFSIFGQLKIIFEKCEVGFLYNILRKIQLNSVHVVSILIDKLEKLLVQGTISKNVSSQEIAKFISEKEILIRNQIKQKTKVLMIPQLGGIHLYNQQYKRGIQYTQINSKEQGESLIGRNKNRQFKCYNQQFLTSVMAEIDNKAEVQIDGINDEIKNYILNYKENTKLANFISCEKELGEIIDFFKISQLEAISFLNKSPNNNNEYTEDYINRLNDLEKQIKSKENEEKIGILEKMKAFIEKMKQKMLQIEKMYQLKNQKLIKYEKSLKKVTVSLATQTYDNLQNKIKQLSNKLREQEQKYQILNQMRKSNSYQDQINGLIHQIQVKNNQNRKLEQLNTELESQLEIIKKFVRQNKDKLTVPVEVERRRVKTRNKITKQVSTKKLTDMTNLSQHQQQGIEERKKRTYRTSEFRQHKVEKKTHRIQKISGFRSSMDGEQSKEIQRIKYQFEQISQMGNSNQEKQILDRVKEQVIKTKPLIQQPLTPRQSNLKLQLKKTSSIKRATQQQSKVSFYISNEANAPAGMKQLINENKFQSECIDQDFIIKQRSIENSRSMLSIQAPRLDQSSQRSRRNQRKFTLRQKFEPYSCSIKEMDYFDSKKSSKSISKKCIILKEKKDKNMISTTIKFTNLAINQQYSIVIKQNHSNDSINEKKQSTKPRPSYPFDVDKKGTISNDDFKTGRTKKQSKKRIDISKQKQKQIIKYKGSQDISGLQSIQTNKSNKGISSSQKIMIKNEQSLLKRRQISKNNKASQKKQFQKEQTRKKERIEIQKTQLRNLGIKSQLKGQNDISIRRSSTLKSEIKTNYKKIAECLQYLKNQRLSCNSQQKWKNTLNNSAQSDSNTIMNQILEEIKHQTLNLEEFQEMIKVVQESQLQKGQLQQVESNNKLIEQEESIHKQVKESINNKQITQKKQINNKSSNITSLHRKKQLPQNNIKNSNKKQLNDDSSFLEKIKMTNQSQDIKGCIILDKISINKLKQIHNKYGNCKVEISQNRFCQHLQKYISIIAKINVMASSSSKKSLKLPIQRIGQGQGQDTNDKERKQKQNRASLKKHTQIYTKNKFYKSDQLTRNYIKSYISTDQQGQEQKNRILPLINNTSSNYYKPKSKIIR